MSGWQSDTHEHPLQAKSKRWIHKPTAAFLLAYGTLLLGVWAEFGSNHLSTTTKNVWLNTETILATRSLRTVPWILDLPTVLFWVSLYLLARLLRNRLKADDEKEDERTMDILRALYQVPNISVIQQYAEVYWPRFKSALEDRWPSATTPNEERRDAMARAIRDALAVIAEMAHRFARGEKARYGANIMLIIGPGPDPAVRFPNALVESLRFHSPQALGQLAGMLYLTADLLVDSIDKDRKRDIPLIALPVPYAEEDRYGYRTVIPGAPTAAVSGFTSMQEDTTLIAEECADFSATVREEIANYFSPEGDGHDVLSFVSIRLGDEDVPIGVLNIDSDHKHVLGLHDQFYISFYALIRPMSDKLAEAVAQYAQMVAPNLWSHNSATPTSDGG